jgi:hypothetical protein
LPAVFTFFYGILRCGLSVTGFLLYWVPKNLKAAGFIFATGLFLCLFLGGYFAFETDALRF